MVERERGVELADQFEAALAFRRCVGADDDAIGAAEVADGGAFLEKLRIGDDGESRLPQARSLRRIGGKAALHQFGSDGGGDEVAGTDRNSRFVGDDLEAGTVLADAAGYGEDILQVGGTGFVGRRAYGNEQPLAVSDARGDIGGERQAPGSAAAGDDALEPGFVDRDVTAVEQLDLLGVDIDADHMIAGVSQACAGDEAHIA